MKSDSVITLARSLMLEHGVGYLSFGLHHYPERPGVVGRTHVVHPNGDHFRAYSKITLDEYWIEVLPESKIKEVVLHEIAHALTSPMNLNVHGLEWRKNCLKVGIQPDPKFRSDVLPHTMT